MIDKYENPVMAAKREFLVLEIFNRTEMMLESRAEQIIILVSATTNFNNLKFWLH